ncbi:MAG: sigma-70 family RNA polymerase sigma factor [Bauldia sp.]|nr:sigma-70 family RNA polymerase sigma factor [Bauldia sp.]
MTDLTSELIKKMDILIRLNSLSIVKDLPSQKDKILMLRRAGLGNIEIAEMLDTSANTVSVTLAKAKRSAAHKQEDGTIGN